jgi:pSer/pThr/pTyr-binding forkhead associated (FHA) protein
MTDTVLDILKLVLLALLYLFFARVLWAVWSEVRTPRNARAGAPSPGRVAPEAPTEAAPRPPAPGGTSRGRGRGKAPKGKRGRAGRLVVIEPKERRGVAVPITGEVTIGREASCTISIPDDTFLSGRHARVFDHDGQPMVEDLGSTNGSFHNGNRLTGIRLLHIGDRVQVGHTILEAQ